MLVLNDVNGQLESQSQAIFFVMNSITAPDEPASKVVNEDSSCEINRRLRSNYRAAQKCISYS
jgi:hypothetical protein